MSNIYMETHSGKNVYPLVMTPEMVELRDITMSLARINRYYGHTSTPMSVLEHSWLVAKVVEERGAPPEVVLGALLHDAKEAYIGDIATPIKLVIQEAMEAVDPIYVGAFIDTLKGIEYTIDSAICGYVGCISTEDMYHEMVKQADADMLAHEASILVHSKGEGWTFSRDIQKIPASVFSGEPIARASEMHLVIRFEEMYNRLVKEITE